MGLSFSRRPLPSLALCAAGTRSNLTLAFRPDDDLLSPDFQVHLIGDQGVQPYRFPGHVVRGTATEHPHSVARGVLLEPGIFQGHLVFASGRVLHFEHAHHHFADYSSNDVPQRDMIVYYRDALRPEALAPINATGHRTSLCGVARHNHSAAEHRTPLEPANLLHTCASSLLWFHLPVSVLSLKRTNWGSSLVGIGVAVQSLTIYETTSSDPYYQNNRAWNVEALLSAFSDNDHSASCLAHLFTHQDFAAGVLGLAYTGSPTRATAGVCAVETSSGTLNTALTTDLNSGTTQPDGLVSLVTTHETGHNFGASHDPNGTDCDPSGNYYVMHTFAVDGSQPNNNDFSDCSKESILEVLESPDTNCFVPTPAAICGNGVWEPNGPDDEAGTSDDEECDAGFADCKLTSGSSCSDYNQDCCQDCQYSATRICYQSFDLDRRCFATTTCEKQTPGVFECPELCVLPLTIDQKDPGTPCLNLGSCTPNDDPEARCRPFCERFSATDCDCSAEDSCRLCCRHDASPNAVPFCPRNFYWGNLTWEDNVTRERCYQIGQVEPVSATAEFGQPVRPFAPFGTSCKPAYLVLVGEEYDHVVNGESGEQVATSQFNLIKTAGTRCARGYCNEMGVCVAATDSLDDFVDFWSSITLQSASDWMKKNIVLTSLIIVGVAYLIIGYCVHRGDKQQMDDKKFAVRPRRQSVFPLDPNNQGVNEQKVKQVAMLMYQPSVVSPYPSDVRKRALHKRAARKPSQRVMWNMADCLNDVLMLDKMSTAFRVKRVACLLHEP
ncbi:uncharacterized protein MONBRDRAFT_22131 [Monosiga brevicollis MX1]|uniref:Peptidase M12B domain-containing protein n=1 Tax=Monosiga brevicollis TaxID=81824 RepID=A9UPN3_MONBE|nr:uncharacterized protein MONBRDRAFT_22131 [Monosiga brevicollis MX1]EDQ92901.1 predicted protein [Monosiga brevicollis MX1]|eukprot:XP_001742663.1 hypothetical protein [Monosiga brevicollis MX1]